MQEVCVDTRGGVTLGSAALEVRGCAVLGSGICVARQLLDMEKKMTPGTSLT